jgi:hypothetical protein
MTEVVRSGAGNGAKDPALQPLMAVLDRHGATLVSQFDAFEGYVREAEREGPEHFPLYKWTKATVENPAMRAKHITTFAVRVGDHEVYAKAAADALEADLRPLVGGEAVTRMSRHDTNPANNLPIPPEHRQ